MSKRHKHKFHQNQESNMNNQEEQNEQEPLADLAAALGGEAPAASEQPAPEAQSEQQEAAPAPEPAPEVPPEPQTKPTLPQLPTPKPKAVEVTAAAPKIKVVSIHRPVMVSRDKIRAVKVVENSSSDDPSKHTMIGRQLIKKFDEYDALCAKAGPKDETMQIKCAYKLNDIMLTCCPRRGNMNASAYQEMIRIVFKRLCLGYGTKYSDATLFRMDYRLPSPSDAMRFDTFWHVMYQLVECAKTGSRITFNNDAVGKILGSPSAMVEIIKLRKAVETK